MESPLYGVLKMPQANNIDPQSPVTFAVFSEAIEELKDLDIAYSRNSEEIYDSSRTVLMDADRLIPTGGKVNMTAAGFETARTLMKLPKYIKNVYGDGVNSFYQEINPSLNTEVRLTGINALLSQIGFKCGFSNGYFVFNEKTGMITATQVESDDRRTIHFIKDVRDKLECCLNELVYAINVFADLYQLAPVGVYEIVYDFGDITYNREEDRARWYGYAASNRIPFWYYLVKFEGMTEEDAKALVEEAMPKEPTLFGGDE
jgi:A118 family predicted phage portal protein